MGMLTKFRKTIKLEYYYPNITMRGVLNETWIYSQYSGDPFPFGLGFNAAFGIFRRRSDRQG